MFQKRSLFAVISMLFIVATVLTACATPTTAAPKATQRLLPAQQLAPASKLAVGIVLPDQRRTALDPGRDPLQGRPESRRLLGRNPVQPGRFRQGKGQR